MLCSNKSTISYEYNAVLPFSNFSGNKSSVDYKINESKPYDNKRSEIL